MNLNKLNTPELIGEEGWQEINFPTSYDRSKSFVHGGEADDRLKIKYFYNKKNKSIYARIYFGLATQGPPGHAHGGSIATVLDETMGVVAWISGYSVVSIELNVKYKKMLPVNTQVTIEAYIELINNRKIITKAKMYDNKGAIFSTSDGTYINLPKEKFGNIANINDILKI